MIYYAHHYGWDKNARDKFKDNIVLQLRANANNLKEYNLDTAINLECVFASKKGEVLESKYVPFKLSNIQ